MKIELLDPYIQVSIAQDSEFLPRAIRFAQNHFQKAYRLSSSVLILDDGERYKKDYFLNWAYHVVAEDKNPDKDAEFAMLLEHSYMPIRIKIVNTRGILERVKVSLQIINGEEAQSNSLGSFNADLGGLYGSFGSFSTNAPLQVSLHLSRPSSLVRRYLCSKFKDFLVSYSRFDIILDASSENFWDILLHAVSDRIINNVAIDFDYDTFRIDNAFSTFGFMTKEEKLLKKSYKVLGCDENAEFARVKDRFIELAKIYHPDNVYGQDKAVIDGYAEKFRVIKEAYENIKNNYLRVA